MRGIPGSGKSTWLQKNAPGAAVFSADDYHVDAKDGIYKFKPENAKAAHDKCLRAFTDFVVLGTANVDIAVSNTNVRVWELAGYVRIAEAFGFEVKIIRMVCDPEIAIIRGVHNVPPETVWKMYCEMEPLPGHWRETPVFTDLACGWEPKPETR